MRFYYVFVSILLENTAIGQTFNNCILTCAIVSDETSQTTSLTVAAETSTEVSDVKDTILLENYAHCVD